MAMEEIRKRERSFSLVLPVFVQGTEEGREELAEQAEVASMSAEEATVRLRSNVRLGAKLRLAIRVPRTFFLEKPLEMSLSGTVIQIQPSFSQARDHPLVRLRLDRTFLIEVRTG